MVMFGCLAVKASAIGRRLATWVVSTVIFTVAFSPETSVRIGLGAEPADSLPGAPHAVPARQNASRTVRVVLVVGMEPTVPSVREVCQALR